jgi:hypothetical protein
VRQTSARCWSSAALVALLSGNAALSVSGCASATTQVALQENLPSLQAEVARAESQGELSRSSVRELASAVLERELSSLREPLGEAPELARCARDVRGALADVAEGSGEAAAFASVALLDAGLTAPHHGDQRADSPLLAVSARRAVGSSDGPQRRAYMLHVDADVRRAALEAAQHSADPADARALLEAARLDPDERSRALAVRALGAIGGTTVVVGLADLWATADPDQRLDIVRAWAAPASFTSGGEQQLLRCAEQGSGSSSVEAALVLLREGSSASGPASTLLLRALRGDDLAARLLALYEVPWSNPELRAEVIAAQRSEDAAVRLISLLRQAEEGPLEPSLRDALRALATGESRAPLALLARVTLARAGDEGIKPALFLDLKSPRARERILGALALAQLGDWGAAAHALADDSPRVRQIVACQLLAEPRSSSAEAALEQRRAQTFGPLAPQLTELLAGTEQNGS